MIPIFILVLLAVPSLWALYRIDDIGRIKSSPIRLGVVGHQ